MSDRCKKIRSQGVRNSIMRGRRRGNKVTQTDARKHCGRVGDRNECILVAIDLRHFSTYVRFLLPAAIPPPPQSNLEREGRRETEPLLLLLPSVHTGHHSPSHLIALGQRRARREAYAGNVPNFGTEKRGNSILTRSDRPLPTYAFNGDQRQSRHAAHTNTAT